MKTYHQQQVLERLTNKYIEQKDDGNYYIVEEYPPQHKVRIFGEVTSIRQWFYFYCFGHFSVKRI
ncbi:MAG: hypothetical protein P1U57_00225 [Oleibacter sp.]|nr:hypothetical protein [Thalassolituus sp.]